MMRINGFNSAVKRISSIACLALLVALAVGVIPSPVQAQSCITCPSYFVSSSARSGVNLRSDPSTASSVLGGIPPGGVVRYLGETRNDSAGRRWMNVVYQEKRGWVVERVLQAAARSNGSSGAQALSQSPSASTSLTTSGGSASNEVGGLSTTPRAPQPVATTLPGVTVTPLAPADSSLSASGSTASNAATGASSLFQPIVPLALLPLADGNGNGSAGVSGQSIDTLSAPAAAPVLVLPQTETNPTALAPIAPAVSEVVSRPATNTTERTQTGTSAEVVSTANSQRLIGQSQGFETATPNLPATAIVEQDFVARPLQGRVTSVPLTVNSSRTVQTGGGGLEQRLITSGSVRTHTRVGRENSDGGALRSGDTVSLTGDRARDASGLQWARIQSDTGAYWVEEAVLMSSSARVVSAGGTETVSREQVTQAPLRYRTVGVVNGLNMRSAPGTQFATIGVVPSNARNINPLGEQFQGWVYVKYGNKTGWVSAQFLQPVN